MSTGRVSATFWTGLGWARAVEGVPSEGRVRGPAGRSAAADSPGRGGVSALSRGPVV